jgi:murein DD-endopeptidase MepM/ murein hydrolase activator NlpD
MAAQRMRTDRRIWGPLLVLACCLLLAAPAAVPAVADGLIIEGRTVGTSGWQRDASELSPAPLRPPAMARAAPSAASYTVAAGDTLGAIAERFGVTLEALAAANGISDPNRITVGQVLMLDGVAAAGSAVGLPDLTGGEVARLQFWPWPPAQGQTLVVWLGTRSPVTASLTYEGRPYPVQADGATTTTWGLIPIPPLTAPGSKPLVLRVGENELHIAVPIIAGSFPSHNIPASTSDAILTDVAKVRAESQRMAELFAGRSAGTWTSRSRFALPLAGEFPRTAPYGSRRTYGNSPAVSAHAGEDFSAAPGTPVYAPAAGTVVLAETLFVRGNAVVLDHGHGVYTGYWHLLELSVAAGEQVTAGQELGKVGSTGLSTGAHLHWELQVNGLPVDPLQWTK